MSGMYDAAVDQLNEDAPAWLAERRQKGLDAWANASMPTSQQEEWRYVDIDFDINDFRPAGEDSEALSASPFAGTIGATSGTVTMVDGCVTAAAGEVAEVGTVSSTSPDLVAGRYGSAVGPDVDIFAAAHHALSPAGTVIVVPKGAVVPDPILVDVQSVADGSVSFPHITIIGEANSQATIVVLYRSAPGASVLSCPIVETFAEDGARISVAVVQNLDVAGRMVAHHQYIAGRDATVTINEIGLGAAYARQKIGIALEGQGSSTKMGGIYFGDGEQSLDYRINVTHRGKKTSSDIFLKGAVADEAQAVWTGLMRIEHGADGTAAFETNRNLVLSDGARVNSVPNLEILTDDLQCGHGSSSGPLEEEHLYYLMSRGLPRDRAERLLVRGFFDEILSDLAVDGLADPARVAVADKFAAAQARGAEAS